MNTNIRNLFLLPVLLTGLGLMLAGAVTAQTFTTLYSFTATSGSSYPFYNGDGAEPLGGVIRSSNILYGTAWQGGGSGYGTVFAVNTDGTGFSTLYNFTGGGDGAGPRDALVLSGDTLYGTAGGRIFTINTDGSGFTTLYSSIGQSDGGIPQGGLVLSGDTLYGTAGLGGLYGNGTVFKINTDGSGFAVLHTFTQTPANPPYQNSDGAGPNARLLLSGNTLYGTASSGGTSGSGTLFAINTDGTGFTNLHSFTATSSPNDLALSGNSLYGTDHFGGAAGFGTIFTISTDGSGFTTLHNFSGNDGAFPWCLLLSANTLYGTAYGGLYGGGTVFAVKTDGTGFSTLYNFTRGVDGYGPRGDLFLLDNTLYGTASYGGSSGFGSVFSVFIPPQLTLTPSGPNVVLSWPTNYAGFTLQSTSDLGSSAVWTTNLPAPVIVNDQNTVTNPISGAQQFFRLSQ